MPLELYYSRSVSIVSKGDQQVRITFPEHILIGRWMNTAQRLERHSFPLVGELIP